MHINALTAKAGEGWEGEEEGGGGGRRRKERLPQSGVDEYGWQKERRGARCGDLQ